MSGGIQLFNTEHDDLRSTLRRFVEREITPHVESWEGVGFPDDVFRRMGTLGFLGLDKPAALGGQGGDFASSMVLTEELAQSNCAGLGMGIAAHVGMAMPPIIAFGTPEQHDTWVRPAIKGEAILCLAITESHAGSDVGNIQTSARDTGSGWVINGEKTFITNGIRADAAVLVARDNTSAGGTATHSLFIVPLDAPGVSRGKPLKKAGLKSSDTALLTFDNVLLPYTSLLGKRSYGFKNIMWELEGERILASAYCVASAQSCLNRTVAYIKQRHAFGTPIGDFQSVRHRVAELSTELTSARLMVYAAAGKYQANLPNIAADIAAAKLNATRTACQVVDECLQLHGGAGYLTETGVERTWRDLRVFRIAGGTDQIMLEIISQSVFGDKGTRHGPQR